MAARKIELKVSEMLSQVDVGRGIARIDTSAMRSLGIFPGDIVEVEGSKRKSPLVIDNAYPSDVGLGLIRMDGLARKNAGSSIGKAVAVRKARISEAKKVTIVPAQRAQKITVWNGSFNEAKKMTIVPAQRGVKAQMFDGDHVCYCDKCNKWGKHTVTSQKTDGGLKTSRLKCPFCGSITLRKMMQSVLNRLLLGRAVVKEDVIQLKELPANGKNKSSSFGMFNGLPFGAGEVKFVVFDTSPAGPVKITETTEVEFIQKRRPTSKR